jgi:hypothetical protein
MLFVQLQGRLFAKRSNSKQIVGALFLVKKLGCSLLTLRMFNFGKPKTAGDWIIHIAGAVVAILLVWWMLRLYVL